MIPSVTVDEKRETNRRRILEASRKVFFEEGFEAANLDEVARRANVAKGTIYRYFESKAELYVAVLAADADVFVTRMRETLDQTLPPSEQILKTGRFYFQHYFEHRRYFRIFWALENQRLIGGLPADQVRSVIGVWQQCLQILADQIERGSEAGDFVACDPWETANIFWVMANGLIQTDEYPELRELRGRDLQRVFNDNIELLLRGLRKSG